jgi:hypothetical protein
MFLTFFSYLKERVRTYRYVLPSDNTKRLLMYYNVMTMTVMVSLNVSSSLKERQDDRYDHS